MQTILTLAMLTLLTLGCESEPAVDASVCADAVVGDPCPKHQCSTYGECTRDARLCCIAATDSDCETSERCMEFGYCTARAGVCVDGAS